MVPKGPKFDFKTSCKPSPAWILTFRASPLLCAAVSWFSTARQHETHPRLSLRVEKLRGRHIDGFRSLLVGLEVLICCCRENMGSFFEGGSFFHGSTRREKVGGGLLGCKLVCLRTIQGCHHSSLTPQGTRNQLHQILVKAIYHVLNSRTFQNAQRLEPHTYTPFDNPSWTEPWILAIRCPSRQKWPGWCLREFERQTHCNHWYVYYPLGFPDTCILILLILDAVYTHFNKQERV